jgi:hypothetical protein
VGEYRLINIVIKINKVILKDTNLPPLVDKFLEEFIGYIMALLINFFSRYNQLGLALKSRDITVF